MIQTFWYAERGFVPVANRFTILPDSHLELIFSFGAPCYQNSPNGSQLLSPCFTVGLLDAPVTIEFTGPIHLLGIRFYPWGFRIVLGHLFPRPLSGLRPAGDPLMPVASQLSARFPEGLPRVVNELQDFLTTQMLRADEPDVVFIDAAQRIVTDRGVLALNHLADSVFSSPRTLRRRFQVLLGQNPKTLARIARFEFVRDSLWENPEVALSLLATTSGYADQAHMQREFRLLAGQTPRQFAEQMRRLRAALNR